MSQRSLTTRGLGPTAGCASAFSMALWVVPGINTASGLGMSTLERGHCPLCWAAGVATSGTARLRSHSSLRRCVQPTCPVCFFLHVCRSHLVTVGKSLDFSGPCLRASARKLSLTPTWLCALTCWVLSPRSAPSGLPCNLGIAECAGSQTRTVFMFALWVLQRSLGTPQ